MRELPFLYRSILDTATITALVMIAFFAVMDRMGIEKGRRDPLMMHFAFFSLSLSGYVFFDNAFAILLFYEPIRSRICTVGVSVCAFALMVSYSGLITQIFDLPRRNRPWFRACIALASVSLLFSMTVYLHGWEWYMMYFDGPAIACYIIIFVIIETRMAISLRSGKGRYRNAGILLVSLHVMILSLFFWRVLININTANYFFNNSILLVSMSFLFPVVISLHRSGAYRELQELRMKQESQARRVQKGLRDLFGVHNEGKIKLTDREIEVCEALLEGLEYKEIQDRTGLSLSGVKKRVHLLYQKIGVQNRTELSNLIQKLRSSAE